MKDLTFEKFFSQHRSRYCGAGLDENCPYYSVCSKICSKFVFRSDKDAKELYEKIYTLWSRKKKLKKLLS